MIKNSVFILFFLFSFGVTAQSKLQLDFKAKKEYIPIKLLNNLDKDELQDYIILENETLVNPKNYLRIDDIQKFCDYFRSLKSIIDYSDAIQFDKPNNMGVEEIKQWNSNIVIYIDRSIPHKIKKSFVSFFSQIKGIDNFNLSFTRKFNEANYLIKVSDTLILNAYSENMDYDINNPYNNVTYSLITDNNKKFYAGTLLIDKRVIDNLDLAFKKLKQMFYLSLGPFQIRESMPEKSLLSTKYNSSKIISDFDINLLKNHYHKIYPTPLNRSDLLTLHKKARKLCKNE